MSEGWSVVTGNQTGAPQSDATKGRSGYFSCLHKAEQCILHLLLRAWQLVLSGKERKI